MFAALPQCSPLTAALNAVLTLPGPLHTLQLLLKWGRSMRARLSIWAMVAAHCSTQPPSSQPIDLLDILVSLPSSSSSSSLTQLGVVELAARLGFLQHKGLLPAQPAHCALPLPQFLESCGAREGAWLLYKNYAWGSSDLHRWLADEHGLMLFFGEAE